MNIITANYGDYEDLDTFEFCTRMNARYGHVTVGCTKGSETEKLCRRHGWGVINGNTLSDDPRMQTKLLKFCDHKNLFSADGDFLWIDGNVMLDVIAVYATWMQEYKADIMLLKHHSETALTSILELEAHTGCDLRAYKSMAVNIPECAQMYHGGVIMYRGGNQKVIDMFNLVLHNMIGTRDEVALAYAIAKTEHLKILPFKRQSISILDHHKVAKDRGLKG